MAGFTEHEQVSVPAKPKYIPKQRPPPEVHNSRPSSYAASRQIGASRKVVISRFLLVDGNISFAIGTEVDGVITRDVEEIPVAEILDHVSPAELERFENQDFFDEDERERLLPPKKPRGRPRRDNGIVPSFSVAPIGEEPSQEQSLLPNGSIRIEKRLGRPKGTFRKNADKLTSTKVSVSSEPSAAIKRARGRPPRQKNLSVVIPSFNGPQPQELKRITSEQSDSDKMLDNNPKPQYSMLIASGLGQSDTEDATARDQSVELVPSLKKRDLDTANSIIDLTHNDDDNERLSDRTKRAKTVSEMSPDPIAGDSIALLRQFQARVYGPDHSENGSGIPNQQSKPRSNLNDSSALHQQFQTQSRPSSPESSSSDSSTDSSMGPTPRPLKSLPAQSIPSKPLPEEASFPQRPSPKDVPIKITAPHLNNSIKVSHSSQRKPVKPAPTKPNTPSKSIPRKISLTPHFPPSSVFSEGSSVNRSAKNRSLPSIPSATRHVAPQPTNKKIPQSSRIMPSPPKKRKPSPAPQSAPSQPSQASSASRIGFAGIPPAKDTTDYFAPKATVAKKPPSKPRHSPTMQLLGPKDRDRDSESENESEDQLAGEPSTSTNHSISSEVIVVRQNLIHPTPHTTTATAASQSQNPSTDHITFDLANSSSSSSSSDDLEDDSSASEQNAPPHISPTIAPVHPTTSSTTRDNATKAQSSAEALRDAFEIDDDEDGDGDSESESDSLSSEVMVVRSG